ncbi:MAG: hypothetical protein ABR588_05885 [Sphingomicrobium sp.]|nr:hypothetical protein [Sphingomonadales bacterium]
MPNLPPGFQLDAPPRLPGTLSARPSGDPLKPLLDAGVVPTNGFRTPVDIQRLRAEGYSPAPNSLHLRGDAVDLTPGTSGMRLSDVQARALAIASQWPGGKVLNEGDHVHLQLPGWGAAPGTPGTPNSGLPPLPPGYQLTQRGSLSRGNYLPGALAPSGAVHDGDTFQLSNGQNARLFGVDAWELSQQGRRPDGSLQPLGIEARNALASQVGPSTPVQANGQQSYGRPIVSLGGNGDDPALSLLRSGNALAEPQYLQGDPRFSPYMEAERLARLNRLGGQGTNAETPAQFRHGDGPWQGATPGTYGNGTAIFGDEATPNYGLRDDIAKAYAEFAHDPKHGAADLIAFGQANGFTVPKDAADKFVAARLKAGGSSDALAYIQPPRPSIDPGDGKFGTTARGFGDPFNMLDEVGGVADSLGLTAGRENVWNSDRRFGDVLWNNIDQNRAIIAHDEDTHPYYRIGGQLTGGLFVPVAGEARTVGQLARIGAVEGGLAGFGAGEGGVVNRLPGALGGTVLGAAGGVVLGGLGAGAARGYRWIKGRMVPDTAEQAGYDAGTLVDNGLGNGGPPRSAQTARDDISPPPPPGYEVQPSSAAMASDHAPAVLQGPVLRRPDIIDVSQLPPLPEGYKLDAPFGSTRPMGERLSADEIAKLGEGVDPSSVLPRLANQVDSLEEAMRANPGPFRDVQAPDELTTLDVRRPNGGAYVRGPLDTTQALRTMGGVRDDGGDLAHLGIDNTPRRMDFGSNEQFLGKLVHDNGMGMDDAALALWERGYFPQFQERPTPADLIDRLHTESTGAHRYFHPDDYEEVARFHDAQAQRGAVERAQDEGSPLAEDVGQHITLDDLEANRAPASAYEDTPRIVGGKLGNINLDRLESPQDVAQLIDHVQKRVGGFDAASRGRITNDETRKLADELGLPPGGVLNRKTGQALNAEQLYAVRALVQKSRQLVAGLAKQAIGGSDEDVLAFRKAWVRHVALEEHVTGATAEAGRALQQFKMLAKAGDARGAAVKAYLNGAGGRESIEETAQKIVDLMEDPAQANHFMSQALKPKWRDKLNELWINSLLSGPKTHVVNFVGNALTSIYSLPEQALTAGIGKVTGSADRSYLGEVGSRITGMVNGSVEGLQRAKKAFVTGEAADDISKVESRVHDAIGGTFGKVVRFPTRALTAADEFWKSINASAELHALAYRKAMSEGTDAADRRARYEALVKAPTGEMAKQAEDAARYYTFQRELGPAGKKFTEVMNLVPGAKLVVPFIRTPANIVKFAGERSVFGIAMPEVRAALAAGGRSRDEALAKITLGSGLSTAAVLAAMHGRLSGSGPSDPRERAALQQGGWQPYSVRVGDRWVSYQRFDPLSLLAGVAADFVEAGHNAKPHEADKLALHLTLGVAKNLTSKTWLSGAADFFQMLDDPDRYGEQYFRNLAATAVVPSVLNQTAQAIDPNLRDARTLMDAIKARTPFLSRDVAPRRDMWGQPKTRGDSFGPDLISPVAGSYVSNDPLRAEVARLRAPVSMPQRNVMVDGERVPLTPEQFDEYQRVAGAGAHQVLSEAIRLPSWKIMTDDQRSELIKSAFTDARKDARGRLIADFPQLAGTGSGKQAGAPPLPPGFSSDAAPAQQRGSAARMIVPGRLAPQLMRRAQKVPALPPGYVLQPPR